MCWCVLYLTRRVCQIPPLAPLTKDPQKVESLAVQLTMDTAALYQNDTALRPRAYQLEMLEESLKKNVIVAVRDS